ncbi:hypothetical protein ACGFYV_26180 [Streptomyces sp. NPDC048297]|uniref:hypothetical protein n=1 Tax=Streptomyces sp. NPDC048297 TaxID=3365531 RepID=UPI0037212648
MSMRRGQFSGVADVRRHLAGGLLFIVAALAVMLLLAPRAGAVPGDPSPTPSPSASFPRYEPGLEPTIPGLLSPPESPGLSASPTAPAGNGKAGGGAQGDGKTKGPGKGGTAKGGAGAAREPSAKEKKAAEQEKLRREMRKKVKEYKTKHGDGGVLNAFEVTDKQGLPISAYRIVSDNGGVTDIPGQIQGVTTQALFENTKWVVAFGCWLISWALSWALASLFLRPALKLSDALYNQTIVQLGVPGLLMAYSGVVAFWNITFGNRSRGWGEIAASTVIGALAVSTFAAPPQLLLGRQDGAVGKARDLGIAVYAITTGHEDALTKTGQITETKARDLTRTVTDGIVEAFVVRPSFLLSYNQQLSPTCVDLYSDSRVQTAFFNDQVDGIKKKINAAPQAFDIVPGVVGDLRDAITNKAVDYVANDLLGMNPSDDFEKACVKDAGAAKKSSWDKVFGALFVFIAAVLMTMLLVTTAFFYLSTQMRLVIEAVLARVALAAGIMPGPGRAWLWERAANIVRLLGLLVVLVVGLAVAIVLVTALLNADFGDNAGALPARFVAVDVAVISCFTFRKRITKRSKAWATSARTRLGASPLGGSSPALMNQDAGRRRSLASTLATTALMVGAIAATGGAAAGGVAAGGSGSLMALGGRGATALGTRMAVRGTTAMANGATRAVAGSAKAAYSAGKFGLKYSVGAPVYLPQAARAAHTAIKAAPGSMARSAAQLRSRLTQPVIRQLPAVRDFSQTYWNNIGGRWVSNQIRMHRGLPPRPHPRTPPPAVQRPVVPAPAVRRPAATPVPATARPRPPRRAARPVTQPAASSQQQALRQRLYRMSTDAVRAQRPAPNPEPQQSQPPARPRAGRPAPARRRTP